MVRGISLVLVVIAASLVAESLSHNWGPEHHHRKGLLRKIFKKRHERFHHHVMHVQASNGEQVPTDTVQDLVNEHREAIIDRSNLHTESDSDKQDLVDSPVDALSYITYNEGKNTVYLIKVIIGNQFIVHVKIVVAHGSKSSLMTVLPDKEEVDKLNKAEFGEY